MFLVYHFSFKIQLFFTIPPSRSNLFPNLVILRFSSRTSGRSFKLLFLNIYSHGSIQASNDKKLTYFSPTICGLKSRDPSHSDFARYPDIQKDFILEGWAVYFSGYPVFLITRLPATISGRITDVKRPASQIYGAWILILLIRYLQYVPHIKNVSLNLFNSYCIALVILLETSLCWIIFFSL